MFELYDIDRMHQKRDLKKKKKTFTDFISKSFSSTEWPDIFLCLQLEFQFIWTSFNWKVTVARIWLEKFKCKHWVWNLEKRKKQPIVYT